jgi:signal transduction histidine kinase
MFSVPLISGLVMLAFGASALKLNARRATNQVFAIVCFVSTAMFFFQLIARYYGAQYAIDHMSNPMPWVRLRFACIGFLCPLMIWTCYYVVSGRYRDRKHLVQKIAPWAVVSLFLMIVPFTEAFKSSASRPDRTLDGPLYTVYFAVMLACELAVCIACIVTAPRLTGIRRLEFRFIAIAFGYLSLAAIAAAFVHNFLRDPVSLWINQTLAVLVFLVFGVSAWGVTSRCVYRSTQVLLPIAERIVVATIVALPTVYLYRWLPHGSNPWPDIAIIGFACVAFYYLDDKVRDLLKLKAEQRITSIAAQLQSKAAGELDPARLVEQFEIILGEQVPGSKVRILTLETDRYDRKDLLLTTRELALTPLFIEGWTSTVSLARMATDAQVEAVRLRLERESIHLLVSPRWSESEPGVILAFGERENRLPFTFPEIKVLRAIAEIVESLYTRCRFSLQARQAEQLAAIGLIGASLAHELRNPIASLRTFAELLPKRLDDTEFLSEWAEVIPDETRRVQTLAEQLLDLARPRRYEFGLIDLHGVISESIFLLRHKAEAAHVSIEFQFTALSGRIVADAQALRQMLLNLVLNSVQSISLTGRPGTVLVRTLDAGQNLIVEIEDNGPGIPDVIRSRLFRPFATAGKGRGLGLGLAICAEIAKAHQGKISAEPHEGGALFRMTLPVGGPRVSTRYPGEMDKSDFRLSAA